MKKLYTLPTAKLVAVDTKDIMSASNILDLISDNFSQNDNSVRDGFED